MKRSNTFDVLYDVADERTRQDERFGVQDHPDLAWGSLLMEEAGEVVRAVNEHVFKGQPVRDIRDELIQVAAVAVAWVEALDRRAP